MAEKNKKPERDPRSGKYPKGTLYDRWDVDSEELFWVVKGADGKEITPEALKKTKQSSRGQAITRRGADV